MRTPTTHADLQPAAAPVARLPVEQLRWRCDPDQLGFASTDDVPPLEVTVGQDRGLAAIELGLEVGTSGYNLFVVGPSGSGRTSTVRSQVTRAAAGRPSPADRCYLHNFREPTQPIAVELPTGQGPVLARDMADLVADCRREIPRVFESERYQGQRAALLQQLNERREALFDQLRGTADRLGFALQITPAGIATVALLGPGKPLTAEGFELLPEEAKAQIRARRQQLELQVDETLLAVRRLERETHEQLHALDRQAVGFTVGHLFDGLRATYAAHPAVVQQLDAIQSDLVAHLDEFRQAEPEAAGPLPLLAGGSAYDRYRVNVVVTTEPGGGAPVVFEPNPTYYNLLGRVDFRATLGAMTTDFTLIRPGALHRANGGFLVLQARDLLLSPFAWDALKRALRDQELRIENLGEQYSAFPTATLKPAPIPLRVKVVLVGDIGTYTLLYHLDPDFPKLFKVKAHFGADMLRSADTLRDYAAFVSGQVRQHGLLPFGRGAVARVVEHGARLAQDQMRLASRFDAVSQLVVEADYRARRAGASRVEACHVDAALVGQQRRLDLPEEVVQRLIEEGTLAIDTAASVVGQVNGLSVLDLGDYVFARPSRITARVGMGAEGVVNVEREVELSGPTHSKGVLVLSGYLLGMYARDVPLALAARLTFEQVYSEIDGDSASSAELYALLSALAEVSLRQGIAVTGSVNQRGEVQAVGEVTRKVEGFFAVCRAQGLDGRQGVIVPAANARHLMLQQEVLDAVAQERFHVWAVRSVDEGLELLTGLAAGERQPDGTYPPGTIHARVQARLAGLATRLAEFGNHTTGPGRKPLRSRAAPNGHPR